MDWSNEKTIEPHHVLSWKGYICSPLNGWHKTIPEIVIHSFLFLSHSKQKASRSFLPSSGCAEAKSKKSKTESTPNLKSKLEISKDDEFNFEQWNKKSKAPRKTAAEISEQAVIAGSQHDTFHVCLSCCFDMYTGSNSGQFVFLESYFRMFFCKYRCLKL